MQELLHLIQRVRLVRKVRVLQLLHVHKFQRYERVKLVRARVHGALHVVQDFRNVISQALQFLRVI